MAGQLTEMNKAMQTRIVEIQTIRDDQNRMTQDFKDKHQKAKKAISHHLEQNQNLSLRLKELLEKVGGFLKVSKVLDCECCFHSDINCHFICYRRSKLKHGP